MTKAHNILLTGIALLMALPALGWDCHYSAKREATIALAGAKRVHVIARAGTLEVRGQNGVHNVRAHGTACTSEKALLGRIRLTATRHGDEIVVEAEIPDSGFSFGWSSEKKLDFVVDVPEGTDVSIDDSSGSMEVAGVGNLSIDDSSGGIDVHDVRGSLDIHDTSGGIEVEGVKGDIRMDDGSGGIDIRRVGGTVTIDDDGSGSIDVREVEGSVIVGSDGSGSIRVFDVKGDFTVRHDGSGGIHFDRVGGRVSIPRD